jgi:hypothetical protein
MTDDAGIGFNTNHGAVKDSHRFATGPFVAAFAEWKGDTVNKDFPDLHSERSRNLSSAVQ